MTSYKAILFYFVLISSLLFTSCKKEKIILPDQELEKIFGKWECILSIGGVTGNTSGELDMQHSNTIEFKDNGTYKRFKDNRRNEKGNFSFTTGISIHTNDTMPIIKFTETGLLKRKNNISQLIKFIGQDTLILSDNSFDGFSYTYLRK